MIRFYLLILLSTPLWLFSQDKTEAVSLQNSVVRLDINPFGGAITSFVQKDQLVNPLSWSLNNEQMPVNNRAGAPFQGHFLCIGRWGSPTAGEMAAGVPHNGDHNNRSWQLNRISDQELRMSVAAPADQFYLERDIQLEPEAPVFHITERVHHIGTVGRLSNIVQHPTLGPPFLNADTRINSNAGAGFLQKLSYPEPAAYAYEWPEAIRDSSGTALDLRRSDGTNNYVSTHVFDEQVDYGWITAYSPTHQLVYGFIWKTEEYPWLNLWHHTQDGKPVAKGLEFGTAGIGRSYQDLLAVDSRFKGHHSFEYHDAGEVKEKHYSCFLIPVSPKFEEVKDVQLVDGQLIILGSSARYTFPLQSSQN